MKKRYMTLAAAMMAGVLMAGGAGALHILAEETAQEETQGGIRAKAPQGSDAASKAAEQAQQDADKAVRQALESKTQLDAAQQAAKDAALLDAGLTEEELTGFRIRKDRDDGRTVYEVELYVNAEEYTYEIDTETAEILEKDYEKDNDYDREPKDPEALTKEEAAQIVLDKVEGATAMDLRIKYDRDDGMELYEGDLVYDGTEYEFELNALDGQILEWSEETY